jgi:hypothetical protein
MKRLPTLAWFGLVLLPLTSAAEEPKMLARPVPVLQQWQGVLENGDLRDLAPPNHVIVNPRQWRDLWTAWRGSEPLPPVDFAVDILLVRTAPGRKGFTELIWRIDEVGNLTMSEKTIFDGQRGFSYIIQRVRRDGIRKVNGTFLPQ